MATLRSALSSRAATSLLRTSSRTSQLVDLPGLRCACSIRPFHQNTTSDRRLASTRDQLTRRTPQLIQPTSRAFRGVARAEYSTFASPSPSEPTIHSEFETATQTWQYIVADPSTKTAVVIDSVLDYDPCTQVITTQSADSLLSIVKDKGYKIAYILETHAHADHLTASSYLQKRLKETQGDKVPIGIGKRVDKVQELFGKRYGIAAKEYTGVFDKLFEDDEEFDIGGLKGKVLHLPGHTPDHLGYKIGDNVFCGDSIFHSDIGTARCDFPGGSASQLYTSGRRLLALPEHTKIWTGHDYPPEDRSEPVPFMTVADHRSQNKHLKDGVTENEFVKMRKERDESLGAPRLIHQSLQVNIRGGRLPTPTEAGQRLLHLPLKMKGLEW